jgi:hypothetical protein
MQSKICSNCKVEKEIHEFNKDKSKKFGVSNICRECSRFKGRNHYIKNIDYYRDYQQKLRNNNPDYNKKNYEKNKEKIKEYNKNSYKKLKNNPEAFKQRTIEDKHRKLLKCFGITLDDYNTMLAGQNGVCAICGNSEISFDKRTGNTRSLSVDHNHQTGQIRGLLCGKCNKMIGLAKDTIKILEQAINYLKSRG